MINLSQITTTARFEFNRSLTLQRIGALAVLIGFPPAMLLIILLGDGGEMARMAIGVMTQFVGLLALLLWATPNVHGELEGRSWSYVTSRPKGRFATLFGKYLNAVVWALIVGCGAVTLCAIEIKLLSDHGQVVETWLSFLLLVFIAAPFYASVFSLIGVIFSRRSMVFGAAYVLLFEMCLAFVPANINKLTGGFHLFTISTGLFDEWLLPGSRKDWQMIYGELSVWKSSISLLVLTIICLAVAAAVIRWREYITSDEGV